MDLFLSHSLGLLWISVRTARRVVNHPADQLLAASLLTWANLVLTRLVLELTGRLGDAAWILGISLALAALLQWPRLLPASVPTDSPAAGPGRWAMLAFALTLIPPAYSVLFTGYLDHPGDAGVLDAAGWLLAGLGLYRLGGVFGLGANAALALSWVGLTVGWCVAPLSFAAHALPASAGMVAGVMFAGQWRRGRHRPHVLLAGLAGILVTGGLAGVLLPDVRWSGPPLPISAPPPPVPDDRRVFLQDFIFSPESGPAVTQGFRPAEGPIPRQDLPRFRSVRQSAARIVIPGQPGVSRLRLRFSLGLLQRNKAEVEILFNGRSVQHCPLTDRGGWIDGTLELNPEAGQNVIEFAERPHQQELDWRRYLERYPDVTLYLVSANLPLEQGALEHFELSGRPEGRIMTRREIHPPMRGAYFFVFSKLQLEGLR